MTDTFLKRRGEGGDECWRGEGSETVSLLSCFLLSIRGSIQHRLSIRHDSPWITFICACNMHTRTNQTHKLCIGCLMVCVWCVSRFVQRAVLSERPSAATLVLSVHHEHMTALWLSGLQLLGDDDCNGMASRGQQCQKLEGDSSTKTGSHALLKLRPLRNGGLSSCSPLLARQICLIMHQDAKLRQKKTFQRKKAVRYGFWSQMGNDKQFCLDDSHSASCTGLTVQSSSVKFLTEAT